MRGVRGALARTGPLPRVRAHARGSPDAGTRRLGRRRARPGDRPGAPTARGALPGRHPCGRDRRQGRRLRRAARTARGQRAPGALARTTVLFVPVFNVDGHERFGAWNRPNQRGPEEMGWRTTAQNLNLNRDYTKADAPEMRALLRLLNAWDPILYARPARHGRCRACAGPVGRGRAGRRLGPRARPHGPSLRDEVLARLRRAGFHALPFYPAFVTDDDPESGFAVWRHRRRASATATGPLAIASERWSRRTRGRTTRGGWPPRARPSSPWWSSPRATARSGWHSRRAADSAPRQLGGQARGPGLQEHGRGENGGVPWLRIHARALGGVRAAVDPLRRDASPRSGRCRSSTR